MESYSVDVECYNQNGEVKLVVEVQYKPERHPYVTQLHTTMPFTISYTSTGELPVAIDGNAIARSLQEGMDEVLLGLGHAVYNARREKGYISEELCNAAQNLLRSLVLTTYCELKTSDADKNYVSSIQELTCRVDTQRHNNYPGVINE